MSALLADFPDEQEAEDSSRWTRLPDGSIKYKGGIFWPDNVSPPAPSRFPDTLEAARTSQARHAEAQAAGITLAPFKGRPARVPPEAPRVIMPTPFVFRPIAEIPQRKWVFGKKALREEITGTIAPGGLGKTALGLVEAAAMATGRNLTGTAVEKPLRVWVWNGGEPSHELERRLAGIRSHYGLTEADFGGRLFIDNGNDMGLILAEQSRDGVTVHKSWLGLSEQFWVCR